MKYTHFTFIHVIYTMTVKHHPTASEYFASTFFTPFPSSSITHSDLFLRGNGKYIFLVFPREGNVGVGWRLGVGDVFTSYYHPFHFTVFLLG